MPTINLVETLTGREKRIYELLCENKCNEEIAQEIDRSVGAVVYHLRRIYAKLGVSSKDKTDLHLCRQRAISYGGTKIQQTIVDKYSSFSQYSKLEILDAVKRLPTLGYDRKLVNGLVSDMFAILEKQI